MTMDDDDDPLDRELTAAELAQFRRPPLVRRARLKAGLGVELFARTYGLPESLIEQ